MNDVTWVDSAKNHSSRGYAMKLAKARAQREKDKVKKQSSGNLDGKPPMPGQASGNGS